LPPGIAETSSNIRQRRPFSIHAQVRPIQIQGVLKKKLVNDDVLNAEKASILRSSYVDIVTSKSVDEIEARVVRLVHDSISKGKITRDEGFILLQRIVREIENEIVLASKSAD
jgi:hypothetical protein